MLKGYTGWFFHPGEAVFMMAGLVFSCFQEMKNLVEPDLCRSLVLSGVFKFYRLFLFYFSLFRYLARTQHVTKNQNSAPCFLKQKLKVSNSGQFHCRNHTSPFSALTTLGQPGETNLFGLKTLICGLSLHVYAFCRAMGSSLAEIQVVAIFPSPFFHFDITSQPLF